MHAVDPDAIALLDRPLYSLAEAARLLRLPERTLARWLRGDRLAAPAIGTDARSPRPVVWGELVEAAFLRRYRMQSVSMTQLRHVVQQLREQFGVDYPLAHFRPFIGDNRELLMELQEEAGVYMVVTRPRGQLVLSKPVREFLDTVEFDAGLDVATAMRPWGTGSAVVLRPDVAFGLPAVHGVRTEILADALRAGETATELAAAYGIAEQDVDEARRWEAALPRRRR